MNLDHLINIARHQNASNARRNSDPTLTAAQRVAMHYSRQESRMVESLKQAKEKAPEDYECLLSPTKATTH